MMEQNAVATEQEAKSKRNEVDLAGKSSDILLLVFCVHDKQKDKCLAH